MLIAGWVKIPVLENKQNQLKLARALSLSLLSHFGRVFPLLSPVLLCSCLSCI